MVRKILSSCVLALLIAHPVLALSDSHLLITKPSESVALENFVIQRCSESVHVALVTLWHFQAARFDLSSQPTTPSFQICKRVINKCQSILFDDAWVSDADTSSHAVQRAADPAAGGTAAVSIGGGCIKWLFGPLFSNSESRGIHPANMSTTLVGVGSALGSAPGMPQLASIGGLMAVQQGRKAPSDEFRRLMNRIEKDGEEMDGEDNEGEDEDEEDQSAEEPLENGHHSKEGSTSSSAGEGKPLPPTPPVTTSSQATLQTPVTASSKPPTSSASDAQSISPTTPSSRFASFASKMNNISNRAASAVGEAFGQTFQIVGPPASPAQSSSSAAAQQRAKKGGSSPARKRAPRNAASAMSLRQGAGANSRSVPNLIYDMSSGSIPGHASSSAALQNYHSQSTSSVDSLISIYPPQTRSRLLRVHYSRTQTNFLATLQDISARLLILPKPARLSALRHELVQLNHSLPKEVCFPLWCQCGRDIYSRPTSSAARKEAGQQQLTKTRHHRVVRINPSEAVVLNSADRAPYLLHVEVLNGDLDFDPDRRSNREVMRKLIAKEEDHRRRARRRAEIAGVDGVKSSTDAIVPQKGKEWDEAAASREEKQDEGAQNNAVDLSREASSQGIESSTPAALTPMEQANEDGDISAIGNLSMASNAGDETAMPDDSEGVDLTEQAFGADLAKFGGESVDGDDSDEDDIAFMNRSHDAAVWTSRRQSAMRQSISQAPDSPTSRKKDFSLDDYSERMRTAAIMLAQLNRSTNAGAQPNVSHQPQVNASAQGGWSSWIIGTSWAAPAQQSEPGQGSAGINTNITGITSPPATLATPLTPAKSSVSSVPVGGGSGGGARLMHADAEGIRKRIMQEMMALEEERMSRTKTSARHRAVAATVGSGIEDEATVMRAVNKDDPSAAHFRESWAAKKARIRAGSPYGHLPNWDVFSVIIKTGADLRQEQLAVQLINEFGRIWKDGESACWVRYFRILVTSENSGLMETITDAISVHSIKKEAYSQQIGGEKITTYGLYEHFTSVSNSEAGLEAHF